MKMVSLAENSERMAVGTDKEPYFPTMHLTSKQMSDLKKKGIGEKCTLVVEVKVKGMNENRDGSTGYTLELLRAGVHKKGSKKDY